MRQNLEDAGVGLLGWCLMTNHIHLIALPERGDSLSVLLRREHILIEGRTGRAEGKLEA